MASKRRSRSLRKIPKNLRQGSTAGFAFERIQFGFGEWDLDRLMNCRIRCWQKMSYDFAIGVAEFKRGVHKRSPFAQRSGIKLYLRHGNTSVVDLLYHAAARASIAWLRLSRGLRAA